VWDSLGITFNLQLGADPSALPSAATNGSGISLGTRSSLIYGLDSGELLVVPSGQSGRQILPVIHPSLVSPTQDMFVSTNLPGDTCLDWGPGSFLTLDGLDPVPGGQELPPISGSSPPPLRYALLDDIQLESIIQAVQMEGSSELVEVPRLKLFDDQFAVAQVVTERPALADLPTIWAARFGAMNPLIGQVQTGPVLGLHATGDADTGMIRLRIEPELQMATTFWPQQFNLDGIITSGVEVPVVRVRGVRTQVTVPDGGTILLGGILNQETWEARKREGLDTAATRGYLAAAFTDHAIELDLEQNTAIIRLVMETGERYVMGDIDFGEHMLKPGILEYIPRFEKGDPYTSRLVARLRTDLWKTGYFSDVNVVEVQRPEQSPPAVDMKVNVTTEDRNHYQGALGWGTDTDLRIQANWSRHPMSASGGRLDLGVGWQQLDDELRIRATHRLPRRERVRQYWITDATLRFENLDLEVKQSPEDEGYIQIANGDIDERHLRFGRMKLTNLASGEHQLFGTTFVQFINTDRRFRLRSDTGIVPTPQVEPLLGSTVTAFSVGYDWDLVAVEGKFFQTEGSRDRAWIFHSNTAFGSDVGFTQAYASTRRSYLVGDRFKFLVRGEVGYTDADVSEVNLDVGGTPLTLSLTDLPNFYRFKAGGSMSVRGYGFEQLSNNDIGSNNIVTASIEGEYRFLNSWSAAAFVDIGNAFNDWSDANLKRGIGVGLRWYSIAGEIRIDVAQAIDFDGKPWRLHISIGTPLL